ncbi:MAG: hypothetical protein AB3N21_11210 [Ruegeria sp.]|uniref:hypothetical protein n=1 Tax=Ruegeria sp. TaxID=1879320 RepID=UPI00349E6220
MERLKKVFGWVLKALGAATLLFALFIGSIFFVSRHDRALAKEFLMLAGEKNYDAAFEMMSDAMKQAYPLGTMKSQFGTLQVYTDVSINNVHLGSGVTTLRGSASTALGCTSSLTFVVENNKITAFQIDDPCLTDQVSA